MSARGPLRIAVLACLLLGGGVATAHAGGYASVSAGNYHTCALRTEGSLVCWGDNYDREATPPAGTFTAVSAGTAYTCALRADETAACWGYDFDGRATPPAGTFKALSAGAFHACAIRPDDWLSCWGFEAVGKLSPPTGPFLSVSTGESYTCAVRFVGSLFCRGWNAYGQATPPTTGAFASVDAGSYHACALRNDATLACWGQDTYGQASPPAGTFASVSGGGYHTCGLRTDGTVACWGYDRWGQADAPAGIFTSVDSGFFHSCGVRVDGSVTCWGYDAYGQSSPPPENPPTTTPPTTVVTRDPAGPDGTDGWNVSYVHVTVSALDDGEGGVVETRCALDPRVPPTTFDDLPPSCMFLGEGSLVFREGPNAVYAASMDAAGNKGSLASTSFKLDNEAPVMRCKASLSVLPHHNHKLVPVTVQVSVADAVSGPAGFKLYRVISDQPDSGTGGGDRPGDVQGWTVGTDDTTGYLRAELSDHATRTYRIEYHGFDQAGHSQLCLQKVTVVGTSVR
jgi:hypothetical protein